MKIGLASSVSAYPYVVKEGSDRSGGKQQHQQSPQKDSEKEEATEDDVEYAVAEFLADQQAQANGLTAAVDGHGPGLKVTLKDSAGTMVRQLSGEEFIKLRQAVTPKGGNAAVAPRSGKILDQKL